MFQRYEISCQTIVAAKWSRILSALTLLRRAYLCWCSTAAAAGATVAVYPSIKIYCEYNVFHRPEIRQICVEVGIKLLPISFILSNSIETGYISSMQHL